MGWRWDMRGSFSLRLTPSSVEVATEKTPYPDIAKCSGLLVHQIELKVTSFLQHTARLSIHRFCIIPVPSCFSLQTGYAR